MIALRLALPVLLIAGLLLPRTVVAGSAGTAARPGDPTSAAARRQPRLSPPALLTTDRSWAEPLGSDPEKEDSEALAPALCPFDWTLPPALAGLLLNERPRAVTAPSPPPPLRC